MRVMMSYDVLQRFDLTASKISSIGFGREHIGPRRSLILAA